MGEDSVDITYGEPFNVAQEIPQTFAATDKEAEWSAVVQKKTERYIPLFKKFENGDMFSWNWAALFGVIWLLYRKAYIAALLIFLLGNLLSCLGVWGLALPIATALLGDFIYYKHVERVVENAKFVPDKKVYYAKKGGTSVVAAFIPLLISIFLCVIIFQALAGFISMFRPF